MKGKPYYYTPDIIALLKLACIGATTLDECVRSIIYQEKLSGEGEKLVINRIFEMPNKWTFQMQSAKSILQKYNVGKGWIDPYAGCNSPAEITNDINTEMPTTYHLFAVDFCNQLKGLYEGVIFDPPYSFRQVTEHYANNGIKATQLDTSSNFYNRTMNAICNKIKPAGYTISFGWNSAGFGMKRGFEIIEILLINHGGHHNDTIVTVEQKSDQQELFV